MLNPALKNRKQKQYSRSLQSRERLRRHLFRLLSRRERTGFSIFELVTVVAVLGILSAIAVTSIGNATKFAQIDEAKALLNSAASECLQRVRTHPTDYATWEPDALKARKSESGSGLPGNYLYKDNLNTCKEVSIHDPSDEASLLMDMKFSVIGGKIVKEAVNKHSDTEGSCNSWGNCGGSESAQYLKACFLEQGTCDSALSTAISTGSNGDKGYKWVGQCTWPKASTLPTCTNDCWVFEGSCFNEEADYIAADAANKSAQCNDYEASLRSSDFDGEDLNATNNECEKNYWWCAGEKMNSKTKYDECSCANQKSTWLAAGGDGELPASSSSCAAAYKCSSREVDYAEYTDTCGNACNNEKTSWLAQGGNGKMPTPNSCTSTKYKCNGSEVTFAEYEATCGAGPACCTSYLQSWCYRHSESWKMNDYNRGQCCAPDTVIGGSCPYL